VQSTEATTIAVALEGTLGRKGGEGFVLHLDDPRCVVGLPRARIVTDVAIATAGPDLRPFLDSHIRVTGDALSGENDMGGSAVVVLVKDVTRLEPRSREL
jgi:hypothetical protein